MIGLSLSPCVAEMLNDRVRLEEVTLIRGRQLEENRW